ncbi:MAG: ATP-dependent DNA helicase RecG [Chloroflexi bacterium]|nr:ATP-dependent DNA helicase RecG [Chloroflexota bacterium]
MTSSNGNDKIRTFANILRLEGQQGFRDRAVIGGLDAYMRRWQDELRPMTNVSRSYAEMSTGQRRQWAEAILDRIGVREQASDVRVRPSDGAPSNESTTPTVEPSKPKVSDGKGRARRSSRKTDGAPVKLSDDVSRLGSVNSRTKSRLNGLGINTVEDLIHHFPHRHDDFTDVRTIAQVVPGETQTVKATIWEVSETGRGRMKNAQAILGDETGNIRVIWFNQGYLVRTLKPGTSIVISGEAKVYRGRVVFQSPEYDFVDSRDEQMHAGRLVPIYPLTEGLYQRTVRRAVKQALDAAARQIKEYMPRHTLRLYDLPNLQDAIWQLHYPDSSEQVESARRRIAFDELLMLQLLVARRRIEWQSSGGAVQLNSEDGALDAFIDSLPYSLTSAQTRSLDEILADMRREIPMSRLLQGDVGSGKTVVATAALLTAVTNGYQGALMAPTEILSEQHFSSVAKMLSADDSAALSPAYFTAMPLEHAKPVKACLLTGSLSKRAKDEMHGRIADGEVDIVIGTQALIQESVDIPRLALVVVDEQHRFGVMQRMNLRHRGGTPHMLAMSATPIPRSVRLTMLGDLELSTIDEMPPGRQEIRTRWVPPNQRDNAYAIVRHEVKAGRQAFIICPLIEESEAIQARAATEEFERLSRLVFPDMRVGLLHGRLSHDEREDVMRGFHLGEIDILVATSVIEVGIDIPNATVMLIDGADRFGLAQLHQFRGRVGRGEHASQCLLLSDSPGMAAHERIRILERTMDGFEIAEEDLRIRGAGEYMGTRQSGLNDLKVARLTDLDIMRMARQEAKRLLDADPELEQPEHSAIAGRFESYRASHPVEIS